MDIKSLLSLIEKYRILVETYDDYINQLVGKIERYREKYGEEE